MKLKETTYNEEYPSFKLGKMDARGEGIPLNDNITIDLVSHEKLSPLTIRTINYKDKATGEAKSFEIASVTGVVVGDVVDNIKYNKFGNANFEIPIKVGKLLQGKGDEFLRGKTIEFKTIEKEYNIPNKDDAGNIILDADGKWVTSVKKNITIVASIIGDDGSKEEVGDSSLSSPKSTKKVPPPIEKLHKEVALDDVSSRVFKILLTNPDYVEWKTFASENVDQFKACYDEISGTNITLEKAKSLLERYKTRL